MTYIIIIINEGRDRRNIMATNEEGIKSK